MTTPFTRAARCVVGDAPVAVDLAAVRGVDRADRVRAGGDGPLLGDLADGTPVYDLAALLGVPAHTDAGDLLLLDTDTGPVALRVADVSRGFPLADADRLPMPPAVGGTAFPAVARTPAGLLPWLDPVGLFAGRPPTVPPAAPWRHRAGGGGLLVVPLPADDDRPWAAAVPAAVVAELFEPDGIAPVPGAADGVAGVILWRNRAVAVIDLAAKLGFPPAAGRPLVAVAAVGGEPVGFRVPRGAKRLPAAVPSRAADRPFPGATTAVRGCVETDAATLALVDLRLL